MWFFVDSPSLFTTIAAASLMCIIIYHHHATKPRSNKSSILNNSSSPNNIFWITIRDHQQNGQGERVHELLDEHEVDVMAQTPWNPTILVKPRGSKGMLWLGSLVSASESKDFTDPYFSKVLRSDPSEHNFVFCSPTSN